MRPDPMFPPAPAHAPGRKPGHPSRGACLTTALLLPALLAACASLAPPHETPPLPVAEAYPGETGTGPAASAAQPAELGWRRFFGDARLQRLIEAALANNRDLRAAILNVELARAQYRIQRADRLPSIGVGVTGDRSPSPSTGEQASTYTAGLQASWEIDLFGRVRNLGEAALARYLATEEGRRATQTSLVATVAQADLALRADEQLLELTRGTLATREDSLRLTQLLFDNGAASELDLRQAQSLVEGARVTLAQLSRQRALDENALVLLIGQPLPRDLPRPAGLDDRLLGTELRAGLPSELLTRRPDIRAAEQQLVAAEANIGAARAAFFPSISLTGSVGVASGDLGGLFTDGRFAWTLAGQLLAPIFDGGRNRANLDGARVQQRLAVTQYEQAIQVAFREVADALAGRATLVEQSRAQQAQIDAESARLRLSDLRYRNGVSSYLDVLDAQRALFAARQAGVQTRLGDLQNRIELYKVLGGGWSDEDAALAEQAAGSGPTAARSAGTTR